MSMTRLLVGISAQCKHTFLKNQGLLLAPVPKPILHCKLLSTPATNLEQAEEPDKLYKLIELEMRGHDTAVLKSYSHFISTAARHLGIEVGKSWTPKKAQHERLTLLRSIHVKKKYRVQYENRTYFTFTQLHRLTGSTADTFLEYLQRNLPEGVAMKITKVGLENIPDHIKPPEAGVNE